MQIDVAGSAATPGGAPAALLSPELPSCCRTLLRGSKALFPGTEPKLTASAKPQVKNTSSYPCFSSARAPPALHLGSRDLTASFHPAFVCLIPFFGAGAAFYPVLVWCLELLILLTAVTAIVLQIIEVIEMQ